MKRYVLLMVLSLMSLSCNSQDKKPGKEPVVEEEKAELEPRGSWKVNKEFDENGNLIRYDSIYSWSSDRNFDGMTIKDRDSVIKSFESRFFKNFSHFENDGFPDFFAQDSVLRKRLFNDNFFESEFGQDFMDIDQFMKQMMERQKNFLKKYRRDLIIEPEKDDQRF